MKTTMRVSDLTKKRGFPSDIDRTKKIVVQIPQREKALFPIILYTQKDGIRNQFRLPMTLKNIWADGLYILA